MKRTIPTILLVGISLMIFCGNSGQTKTEIDYKSIMVKKTGQFNLKNVGRLKQIVQLETTENSVVAEASIIKRDKEGNFYVADCRSSQKVFCFDKNGKFLRSFGKLGRGPGEVHRLQGFDLTSKSDIVMVSDTKLIKFDKNGALINEIRIKEFIRDICIINDLIYLSPVYYRSRPPKKHAVLILDENFKNAGGISSYDDRLRKYLNLPHNVFTQGNDTFYFLDYYDFALNMIDLKSNDHRFVRFPSDNKKLDRVWRRVEMKESDMEIIKDGIHRFNKVYACGKQLVLYEYCINKNIFDYWIFNPVTKKAIIFPYSQMTDVQKLFFFRIFGSDGNDVFVAIDCDTEEELNKYKKEFPILNSVDIDMEDNPTIGIFEFNEVK